VPVIVEVAEPADPRLVDYLLLTDVARRRLSETEPRSDAAHGIFIAEGEPVVRRALDAGFALRSLLLDPKRLPQMADLVETMTAPTYVASPDALRETTGFHVHRGILGSFARKPPLDPSDLLAHARRLLICEALTSTTNLGAVLRSAAALGIDGVLLSPECCDPLYRRAVRVSMGESLRLPIARVECWPDALSDARSAGFAVLALTPAADARPLPAALQALPSDQRVALLLGEEGTGVSGAALLAADERVRIPMSPGVDSLNVAAAAAIACFLLSTSELA
jgi:tRNA G18 (ribose-2'-O)-methylase SpoU